MPFFFRRKAQPLPIQEGQPTPQAEQTQHIQLGDHTIRYTLRRSQRRSIGFTINHDGLRVTAPTWVNLVEIEHAIRTKQNWILTKLAARQQLSQQPHQQPHQQSHPQLTPQTPWQDGATLPYLGENLTLCLQESASSKVTHINHDPYVNTLTISLPANTTEQELKKQLQRWLQSQAQQLFVERVQFYGEKLGAFPTALALSSANTRWGSCTSKGKIRLNWRLMHFPLPLIDYVIAHELAHLKEMNHSPRFWATVASIFPDFVHARNTLRQQAQTILPTF